MNEKTYIAIDLKSFYASVECVMRHLDPMTTNLLVADASKTEKTICLAVSPTLKSYGISGRARLFEAIQQVERANNARKAATPGRKLVGSSYDNNELNANPALAVDFITAPPRMALYSKYSAEIVQVYKKYVAPEDIYPYSIDEVFIDATPYLKQNNITAHDFARRMIRDVLNTTGITATAGIGPNLFLCKVALDITAKHIPADKDGVRIATLTEDVFRRTLWEHRPLTDFWSIGKGIADRLEKHGLYTLGDVAEVSEYNEDMLYKEFGKNAEYLIDHAWGWEPVTLADIHAYRPESISKNAGQVLQRPYSFEETRIVVREMLDSLSLDLVEKRLVTDQLTLTVGYDIENLKDPERRAAYKGEVTTDRYGRKIPKHAHGTANLGRQTSSTRLITDKVLELFDRIVDKNLLTRRLTISANHLTPEDEVQQDGAAYQSSLFEDPEEIAQREAAEQEMLERERRMQETMLDIRERFGKNAILKGTNLQEAATGRERNRQLGGHKA